MATTTAPIPLPSHLQLSFSRSVPVHACVRQLLVRLLVPPVRLRAALSPCVLCVPSSATCNSLLGPFSRHCLFPLPAPVCSRACVCFLLFCTVRYRTQLANKVAVHSEYSPAWLYRTSIALNLDSFLYS